MNDGVADVRPMKDSPFVPAFSAESLRDMFAAFAMGWATGSIKFENKTDLDRVRTAIASESYKLADAMLAERSKEAAARSGGEG